MNDTLSVVNFFSGIVWIPYCGLLFYFFHEHRQRKKFPQNLILFLLFFGSCFRCVWFFVYYFYDSSYIGFIIINRVAILLQFAAVSVLMTMWVRTLIITNIAEKIESSRQNSQVLSNRNTLTASSFNSNNLKAFLRQYQNKAALASEKVRSLETKHFQGMVKFETEKKQQYFVTCTIVVNVVVWALILCTVSVRTNFWYSINLILISLLCLFEAIVTLVTGLRVALLLQKEMHVVSMTKGSSDSNTHRTVTNHRSIISICCSKLCLLNSTTLTDSSSKQHDSSMSLNAIESSRCGHHCQGLYALYTVLFQRDKQRSFQVQRDVLRTVINVTIVVFVFFLIRSVCFSFDAIFHV
jgi:hypothetical protein